MKNKSSTFSHKKFHFGNFPRQCFSVSLLLFFSALGFSQANAEDIYNSTSDADFSLNDGSSWRVGSFDGEAYNGVVSSSTNNLNISVNATSSGIGEFSEYIVGNNLNFNVASNPQGAWGHTFYFNQGAYFRGDVNFSSVPGYVIQMRFGNKTFKVDGNISLNSPLVIHAAQGAWEVGGNFDINNTRLYLSGNSTSGFTVWGTLNLSSVNSSLDFAKQDGGGSGSKSRMIGGINGIGRLQVGLPSIDTTVILTNNGTAEFSGKYATKNGLGGALHLNMNANSDTGKQIMRFQEFADYSDEKTFKMADLGRVTVEWGELNVGMHSAMSAGMLTVVGEKAIFSSTGLDSGSEIGTTRFSSIDFQSGTIRFELSEMQGDRIDVAGGVNVLDPTRGTFLVNVDPYDLAMWLEASEVSYLDYTVMSFDENSSNITIDVLNQMLVAEDGVDVKVIEGDLANGLLTLRVSVPDPSAIAAIIALASLGLAMRRRKI